MASKNFTTHEFSKNRPHHYFVATWAGFNKSASLVEALVAVSKDSGGGAGAAVWLIPCDQSESYGVEGYDPAYPGAQFIGKFTV